MTGFLEILLYIVVGAVVLILAAGIYALFRGGDFGRSWSNKLMRARVLVQFIAVLLVLAVVWLQRSAGAG
jgi:heme/copper-type cytochrome/quinol oxidase subunit 1